MKKKYILILCSEEGSSLVSYIGQYNSFFAQERMSHDIDTVSKVINDNGYTPLLISFHEDARYLKVSSRYKKQIDKSIIVTTMYEVKQYINDVAGLVLLGLPGRSGSGAFIDGTNNKLGWHDYLINHKAISEAELFAIYFGFDNIPVIFASGCDVAMRQDKESFPDIPLATTKIAINRNLASCLSEKEVDLLLKSKIQEALNKIVTFKPMKLDLPLTVTIVFNRTDYCDDALQFNNYRLARVDARTLEKEIKEVTSINDFVF